MMNQEKLKGHLLILAANILFAINMPVSKYLLPEHVQPEALTSMRMSFACVMFWITSLFVPYEKVPLKDLGLLCLCALCGVGLNQGLFIWGLNTTSPVDASIIATAVPHLCHDLGGPDPKGTYHTDENVRGTAWYMRGDLLNTTIHARFQSSEQSRGKPLDYG